jgi:hypothetical protein
MLEEYNSVEEVENLSARVFTIVRCIINPTQALPGMNMTTLYWISIPCLLAFHVRSS